MLIDKHKSIFCQIINQLKTTQGITEPLKTDHLMKQVGKMNCIR